MKINPPTGAAMLAQLRAHLGRAALDQVRLGMKSVQLVNGTLRNSGMFPPTRQFRRPDLLGAAFYATMRDTARILGTAPDFYPH